MDENTFKKILFELSKLADCKEVIRYLDSVIENEDYQKNGLNEQLIDLRNKIYRECYGKWLIHGFSNKNRGLNLWQTKDSLTSIIEEIYLKNS